jgi:hypothetical protein
MKEAKGLGWFSQNRVKIGAEFNQSCPRKASYKNKKWKQVINS